MNNATRSTTFPGVTLEWTTAGGRVRREGKGDTLFITHDDRARSINTYLIIFQGHGVVGRVACVDGDWFIERGVYRHWDATGTPWQAYPSSTVETIWGFDSLIEAVAHEAIEWLS